MTLRSLKWTFTLGLVTRSLLVFWRGPFLLFCFPNSFSSAFATVLRRSTLAPKTFQLPPFNLTRPGRAAAVAAFTLQQTFNHRRGSRTPGVAAGVSRRGWWRVGESVKEQSCHRRWLGADSVMQMGHCDLRLFLSADLSAPLGSASAPSLALCYPCHLCLDTVGLSPCVCVCEWVTAQTRDHGGGALERSVRLTRVTCCFRVEHSQWPLARFRPSAPRRTTQLWKPATGILPSSRFFVRSEFSNEGRGLTWFCTGNSPDFWVSCIVWPLFFVMRYSCFYAERSLFNPAHSVWGVGFLIIPFLCVFFSVSVY